VEQFIPARTCEYVIGSFCHTLLIQGNWRFESLKGQLTLWIKFKRLKYNLTLLLSCVFWSWYLNSISYFIQCGHQSWDKITNIPREESRVSRGVELMQENLETFAIRLESFYSTYVLEDKFVCRCSHEYWLCFKWYYNFL
jgi:hypothetical protein